MTTDDDKKAAALERKKKRLEAWRRRQEQQAKEGVVGMNSYTYPCSISIYLHDIRTSSRPYSQLNKKI